MRIERRSPIDGKIYAMDLPITQEQYDSWRQGMLIQRAMPQLTPNQREFIISGLLPGQFDEIFSEEEE